MKKSTKAIIVFLSILGVIIVALVVYSLTQLKVYDIAGPSMAPTLTSGERILTTKEIPSLQRDDIVVFRESGQEVIKRIIGLPGDRVVIKNGSVTIYNSSYPNGLNPDGGKSYISKSEKTAGNVDLVVPKNEYYVLGDNRGNSLDSRYFGSIPRSSIIAKELRIWKA